MPRNSIQALRWVDEGELLLERDTSTCGGFPGLIQCAGPSPLSFCCPTGTTCLALEDTPSVSAAICCPNGQDCNLIGTVSCDESLQNATANPKSQLHSDPPQSLSVCGSGCCPMGNVCRSGQCHASTSPTVPQRLNVETPSSNVHTTTTIQRTMSTPRTQGKSSTATALGSLPTSTGMHAISSPAASSLSASAKVAIGVLAASIGLLLLGLGGWYCLERRKKKKERSFEVKMSPAPVSLEKAELSGSGRSSRRLPVELDAVKSPKELPAAPGRPWSLKWMRFETPTSRS